MKLYDTAVRDYVQVNPPARVDMYVCGITPYDAAHLGHIFTFMTYDLLQRRLEDRGHEVRLVRNITDVDEPIYARAKTLGIPYTELACQEVASFRTTMDKLGFKRPYAEPSASEYITHMADTVQELVERGFGYRVDNDIYFDTSRFPEFGALSGFSRHLQMGLAAMRGGDPKRAGKRQPLDFLLWKGIDDATDPARWETPLGMGRPGWHIECSVMASELLDVPFFIHGGGADLIFPHHSAEVAQSFGMGHAELAQHWMHVYPMLSDGEKMSKSLGNLVFAKDLLNDYEPAVIRLALMHYHHRIGGEWQPELLKEAEQLLHAFRIASTKASRQHAELLLERVRSALDDDLNTLEVIDAMQAFIAENIEKPSEPSTRGSDLIAQTLDLLGLAG
ncbi:MAG TPA: hypothetical protein VFN56_05245 [Candidatus Saccharimonadales bacterium]|nr:hypothetical protein [Candidatus Saccharimonadales bacterium]